MTSTKGLFSGYESIISLACLETLMVKSSDAVLEDLSKATLQEEHDIEDAIATPSGKTLLCFHPESYRHLQETPRQCL
jgi:hypothetical protein